MNEIIGTLIVKREGEGTLSEGNDYYLKPLDDYKKRWDEIFVRKQTELWEDDPNLHKFINKQIKIYGEIIETKSTITIDYSRIEEIK